MKPFNLLLAGLAVTVPALVACNGSSIDGSATPPYTPSGKSAGIGEAALGDLPYRLPGRIKLTITEPVASPTSLTFDTAATQKVAVSETGYAGAFTMFGCAGVASASPSKPHGPKATVTVTPVDGGKCRFTIADSKGRATQVTISVSGGGVIISGKRDQSPVKGEK